MSYIYILTNPTNKVLYIGVTNNLVRRIYEHKQKMLEGFSSRYNLTKLVYYEQFDDIAKAIAREKVLKEWRRSWKECLINKLNPAWRDLYDEICF
ncbi:MAG: GIY-YIG nuclease family protein [Elusimicrobia bacterium]|nr:GIY-YIG nuclease family protein [Elusimicrobiota bacterium]